MKNAAKLLFDILTGVFIVLAITASALLFLARSDSNRVPSLNGNCFICLNGSAMNGEAMREGDIIIGKKPSDSQRRSLQRGDVISYRANPQSGLMSDIITKRIDDVTTNAYGGVSEYITRGDNIEFSAETDSVPPENIICVYDGTRFGGIGYVLSFLQTKKGFVFGILIPLGVLFVYHLIKYMLTALPDNAKKEAVQLGFEEDSYGKSLDDIDTKNNK